VTLKILAKNGSNILDGNPCMKIGQNPKLVDISQKNIFDEYLKFGSD